MTAKTYTATPAEAQHPKYVRTGAIFSPCRTWRYTLARWWEPAGAYVNFICLNPSTADEAIDDRTIIRCVGFAKRWGYAGLVVTNIFAYRATHPEDMVKAEDPIGPENDSRILSVARHAGRVICAWGIDGKLHGRASEILNLLHGLGIPLYCLGVTKHGWPKHPLYLRGDTQPTLLEAKTA